MTNRVEVKITIAKLIEVAYSKDKGMATKIIRSKGNFKLTVDQNGNAILSGSVGTLTFEGDTALTSLGAKLKNASISFSKGENNNVKYLAMFSFSGAASISISGGFDVEELILSCSGLLCQAARAFKGRHTAYDMELKKLWDIDMKRLLFSVFLIFFLISCTQIVKTTKGGVLYNQYAKYISLLDSKQYVEAIELLSERNQNDLKENPSINGFSTYFPIVSSINKTIGKEVGSIEEADKTKGCLTVNGYDSSNEPTSINLEFHNENGLWRLDYIQVMYHESIKQFPTKATCPTRF